MSTINIRVHRWLAIMHIIMPAEFDMDKRGSKPLNNETDSNNFHFGAFGSCLM